MIIMDIYIYDICIYIYMYIYIMIIHDIIYDNDVIMIRIVLMIVLMIIQWCFCCISNRDGVKHGQDVKPRLGKKKKQRLTTARSRMV